MQRAVALSLVLFCTAAYARPPRGEVVPLLGEGVVATQTRDKPPPAQVAGVVLSILGAVYVPVGGAMVGLGQSQARALIPVGGVLLGAGVLALAVGLPLWLRSRVRGPGK